MKHRALAAAAAIAILGATGASTGTASAAPHRTGAAPHFCGTLAGSTITLTTDVGLIEKFTYATDLTQLTAEVLAPGPFPLQVGTVVQQAISTAKVGPMTYMVSWVESSGLTVTEVQNLLTKTAQLFWTYPADDGSRVGEQHTGTLVCDAGQQ